MGGLAAALLIALLLLLLLRRRSSSGTLGNSQFDELAELEAASVDAPAIRQILAEEFVSQENPLFDDRRDAESSDQVQSFEQVE